jgi:hypothetical protein
MTWGRRLACGAGEGSAAGDGAGAAVGPSQGSSTASALAGATSPVSAAAFRIANSPSVGSEVISKASFTAAASVMGRHVTAISRTIMGTQGRRRQMD